MRYSKLDSKHPTAQPHSLREGESECRRWGVKFRGGIIGENEDEFKFNNLVAPKTKSIRIKYQNLNLIYIEASVKYE